MPRLGALALAIAAFTAPALADDAAPGEILRAAQASRPGASAPLPRQPAPAIALLADAGHLPAGDLTPILVQALRQPESLDTASREALSVLLAPPPLRAELVATRGTLKVHYAPRSAHEIPSVDGREPIAVRAALDGLAAARQEAAALGLRGPVETGEGGFDLYLAPLGGRVLGYAAPRPEADASDPWAGFAVLDPYALGDPAEVRAFAARLYGRAIGFAYRPLAPAWWSEPAAFWFEDRVAGTASRHDDRVAERRQRPEAGLQAAELGRALGNLDLLRTLDADGDGRRVRAVWEAAALHSELPMIDALDLGARGDGPPGSGLDTLLADLTVRAAVETDRGDGPPLRESARHDTYPVAAIETMEAVEPLGVSVVVLEADDEDGGLRLRLEGAPGLWGADLLLRKREGGGFVRAPLVLDESGGGEIGLPWADFDRAILLVRHRATEGSSARFSYTAMPESRYPFAVTSVAVLREDAGPRVTWETSEERDMFGWMVYRAPASDGPWTPLTRFPIPALGTRDESAVYQIVDDADAGAGDAYYRVVGVTRDGLTRALDAGPADR